MLINASDASSASAADGFAWAFVDLTFDANKTSVTFPIELMWRLDSTGEVPVVLTQWSEWCSCRGCHLVSIVNDVLGFRSVVVLNPVFVALLEAHICEHT